MKMIKGIIVAVLIAAPLMGFGEEVTNVTWKSSISMGATYKDGNTDKTLYTMDFKAGRLAPKTDWLSSIYGEYGKTDGDQTEGQLRAQSAYRRKFGENKKFFGGIFAEGYHDAIKDINYRIKAGPNVGYYWIYEEKAKFDTSVGVNAVYEDRADGDDDRAEWRVSANYLREITETARYYFHVEYSADVEDHDNGSGLLYTGLKSKISEKLSMFVEFRDEYDNMPADSADHNDVTILAGLSYQLL